MEGRPESWRKWPGICHISWTPQPSLSVAGLAMMAIGKGLRSSSYIWNESLRDMAAKNNKIILGCIISRASRNKGQESPTLLCVSQIPWVRGL